MGDRVGHRPVPVIALSALLAWTAAQAHTIATDRPLAAGPEWWLVLLLVLSAGLYALGVRALCKTAGTFHGVRAANVAAFFTGWCVLALALLPPLDPLGAELFSAHMLQHELLMLVAAPLLVLGRPLSLWIWALPPRWRPALGAISRRAWIARPWSLLTDPLCAWLLHAVAIWLWHLPALFAGALQHKGIHVMQHCSFLFSALLFWWTLLRKPAAPSPMAIVYLLTTMIHTSVLGALLVFSTIPWYDVYGDRPERGLSALEDQQLGGLIMWIPGGLVYAIAAIALLARWLMAGAGREKAWSASAREAPRSGTSQ